MDVLDAINKRASVRVFAGEPLTQEETDILIDAALRAPSSGNLLHYSVVQVTSQEVKDALYDVCFKQPFIRNAPLVLVFNADENRNSKWIEEYGGHFHFDGPCYLGKGFCDALIAAQNVVLASEGLGLGSVYVGSVLNKARDVRRVLAYPRYVVPVVMLCVGRPKVRPKPRWRLPARAILHVEKYQDFSKDEIRQVYQGAEADWQAENPGGVTGRNGLHASSYSEYRTLVHYNEVYCRQADVEFREAARDAGFVIETKGP